MEYLKKFKENNYYSNVKIETKHIKISKPWNDETFIILIDKYDDLSALENVKLIDYLVAIYHDKEKKK